MSLKVEEQNGVSIIRFTDEPTSDISYELRDELRNLFKEQKYHIVIDMSSLELISSSFLSVLLAAWELAQKEKGEIALCGISDSNRELLQVTQTGEFFSHYPSVEDAVEIMSKAQ